MMLNNEDLVYIYIYLGVPALNFIRAVVKCEELEESTLHPKQMYVSIGYEWFKRRPQTPHEKKNADERSDHPRTRWIFNHCL
jgi:hypothetical protein